MADCPVEALNVSILLGFATLNELQPDPTP